MTATVKYINSASISSNAVTANSGKHFNHEKWW